LSLSQSRALFRQGQHGWSYKLHLRRTEI